MESGKLRRNTPSVADVAKLSKVSTQTVSRVLNNHPSVSPEKRSAVLKAIETLDYHVNLAAQTLSSGNSKAIGIIWYGIEPFFGWNQIIHSIQLEANAVNRTLLFGSVDSFSAESIQIEIRRLVQSGIAGLIIIVPVVEENILFLDGILDIPYVLIEGGKLSSAMSVNGDQKLGASLAAEHLVKLGHKKIGHVTGPASWSESKQRINGFKMVLEKNSLDPNISIQGDWSSDSGYACTKELLEKSDVSAIFYSSDYTALGGLKALSDLGIKAPKEISIVGFDDTPEARFFIPSLTTIRLNFREQGRLAFNLLINKSSRENRHIFLLPELIIRESTSKFAKS